MRIYKESMLLMGQLQIKVQNSSTLLHIHHFQLLHIFYCRIRANFDPQLHFTSTMSDQARKDVNNAIISSDAGDIARIVDAGNSSKARREEAKQRREEEEERRKREEEEKAKASGS
jgi:hypothetical protein